MKFLRASSSILVGIAVFALVSAAFMAIGLAIGVPTWIDFGDGATTTFGSGRYSYDEEVSGGHTTYGFATFSIALMLSVRAGEAAYRMDFSGRYTTEDNLLFAAWVMGFLAVAFVGAASFRLFAGDSWLYGVARNIVDLAAIVMSWKVFNGWRWNRIARLKQQNER